MQTILRSNDISDSRKNDKYEAMLFFADECIYASEIGLEIDCHGNLSIICLNLGDMIPVANSDHKIYLCQMQAIINAVDGTKSCECICKVR
jgi:hypothetical protein